MAEPQKSKALIPYQPATGVGLTEQQFECVIAAILTTGTFGADGGGARTAVKRYAETLAFLRHVGGVFDPKMPD